MMDELDNYTDGEALDWLFDLAGVTTVEELENILIEYSKAQARVVNDDTL